jgi:hypothetical protein
VYLREPSSRAHAGELVLWAACEAGALRFKVACQRQDGPQQLRHSNTAGRRARARAVSRTNILKGIDGVDYWPC